MSPAAIIKQQIILMFLQLDISVWEVCHINVKVLDRVYIYDSSEHYLRIYFEYSIDQMDF